MKIPNLIDIPVVGQDGKLTDPWRQILTQLFTELQKNVSNEGFIIPQQPTANITTLSSQQSIGAILYNSDTDKFEGCFKKIVGPTITGEFKEFATIGGDPSFSSVTVTGLTANRAVITDASSGLDSGVTTDTELGYLSGVTSGVQTQINGKEPTISAGTSGKYWRGDKTWQTLNTLAVTENTNLYYTDARSRAALSNTAPITYSSTTGAIGITQATTSTDGYLSSTDWNTFNNKQAALGYTPLRAGTASVYLTPSNPTALTSTSYLMFGLGSTLKFTPTQSGIIRFSIKYVPGGVGTTGLNNFKLAYGSGAAPANAAAATGTVVGGVDQGGAIASVNATPAINQRNVIVTGLTPGVTYWFDIQGAKNAAHTNVGIFSIESTIQELSF
jgi:hypothetical protein